MSVFSPMSFGAQPDRKKALLDQLMQQYHEAASRAAGLEQGGSMAGAVGATPFRAAHQFGGTGLYTAMQRALPPGLAARLGPGAIGVPSPGHSSSAPGLGVGGNPGNGGGNPGLRAGGPSNPIAAANIPAPPASPAVAAGVHAAAPNADPSTAASGIESVYGLHPEIVQRIARQRSSIYSSPFHSGVGVI